MVQVSTSYSTMECCLCLEVFEPLASGRASSSTKPPSMVVQPLFSPDGCMHFTCRPCLKAYFQSVIHATPSDRVLCPSPDCQSVYDPGQTVPYAFQDEDEAFSWWRTVILRCFIPENRVSCPFQDCQAPLERPTRNQCPRNMMGTSVSQGANRADDNDGDDDDELDSKAMFSECPACHRGICLECGQTWHKELKECSANRCQNDERCARSRTRATAREAKEKKKSQARDLSIAARRMAESQQWTRCPRCQEMVERREGCNTITCKCQTEFCYVCGSISKNHGCSRKCNTLSPKELAAVRACMFKYDK